MYRYMTRWGWLLVEFPHIFFNLQEQSHWLIYFSNKKTWDYEGFFEQFIKNILMGDYQCWERKKREKENILKKMAIPNMNLYSFSMSLYENSEMRIMPISSWPSQKNWDLIEGYMLFNCLVWDNPVLRVSHWFFEVKEL